MAISMVWYDMHDMLYVYVIILHNTHNNNSSCDHYNARSCNSEWMLILEINIYLVWVLICCRLLRTGSGVWVDSYKYTLLVGRCV